MSALHSELPNLIRTALELRAHSDQPQHPSAVLTPVISALDRVNALLAQNRSTVAKALQIYEGTASSSLVTYVEAAGISAHELQVHLLSIGCDDTSELHLRTNSLLQLATHRKPINTFLGRLGQRFAIEEKEHRVLTALGRCLENFVTTNPKTGAPQIFAAISGLRNATTERLELVTGALRSSLDHHSLLPKGLIEPLYLLKNEFRDSERIGIVNRCLVNLGAPWEKIQNQQP